MASSNGGGTVAYVGSERTLCFLMHGTYAQDWWAVYMEETLAVLQETPMYRGCVSECTKGTGEGGKLYVLSAEVMSDFVQSFCKGSRRGDRT